MNSFCVFGDSVAKGVVYDGVRQKYVFLKDSCVNLLKQLTGMEIKNYSRFGCTVLKGQQILEQHADELHQYDRVCLEFGGNDCDYNWAEIAERPDIDHQPNVPLPLYEEKYVEIVRDVRRCGGTPAILTLPPIVSERFFAWVSKGLNADNILKWLGDKEGIYRWHEMYNHTACRVALNENVPIVDIRQSFLTRRDYVTMMCEDGMHPNAKGHRLITEAVNEHIKAV